MSPTNLNNNPTPNHPSFSTPPNPMPNASSASQNSASTVPTPNMPQSQTPPTSTYVPNTNTIISRIKATPTNLKIIIILLLSIIAWAFILITVVIPFFFGTIASSIFHDSSSLHSDQAISNYIKNLECGPYDQQYSCNLRNKYEVVSAETTIDNQGKDQRTVTFRIKNTDLIFTATSSYKCTMPLDASCLRANYSISSDFHKKAFDYVIQEYNKQYHYDLRYNHISSYDETVQYDIFTFTNREELNYLIGYFDNFLDYLNTLDFYFITGSQFFSISYEDKSSAHLSFKFSNNRYVYNLSRYDKILDNLTNYFNDYLRFIEVDLN